ncbi:MAG: TetR/AcrR family transcriptional regulator [Myxococcota bacterium]
MSRVSRKDWCTAGLGLLRDEGHEALTIDRVATAIGKSKGSFYHHFEDLSSFHAALLATWEEELTERPIAQADAAARRRAARLDEVVLGLDHALDRAVRAWANADARAKDAVVRVDERRIAYLAGIHREAGHRDARTLAELEYAAFVGFEHLDILTTEKAEKLGRKLRRALAMLGGGGT